MGDAPFLFLITLASAPIFMVAIIILVWKLIDKNIDGGQAILGIGTIVLLMVFAIASKSDVFLGVACLSLLIVMLMWPFAERQLDMQSVRAVNADRIERLHQAVSERPDNIPAQLELAACLHAHGFIGHGIELARVTLEAIPDTVDPMTGRSPRNMYTTEVYELKKWMGRATPEQINQRIKCASCMTFNPPGTIACSKCNEPYLLNHVRKNDFAKGIFGRFVVTGALVTAVFSFTAWASVTFKGAMSAVVVLAGLTAAFFAIRWLFTPGKYSGSNIASKY
ncbi:MAG: hypothetical protein KDC26_04075 [Armatimonadetes bacterium]|nr:hypothetical protein [Armatimonadota bacterium]